MAAIAAPETRAGKVLPSIDVLNHSRIAAAGMPTISSRRAGLFARLKSWAVSFASWDRATQATREPQVQAAWHQERSEAVSSSRVVQFPRSDQAYLRRLGSDMKARFASLGVGDFAPFIFEIDPALSSRFWIDPVAYVDLINSHPGFRIVIDDEMFGYLTFQTDDFDSIHTLVCHYVLASLTARLRSGDAQ